MKRIVSIFGAACLLLAAAAPARADEGMWMLPLLQKMNVGAMHKLGCSLSAKDIYDVNHTSLKDAVVQFGGGCTGELISREGLLVTNHHCGYDSIQKLSSTEHNYLEDGYWAMNRTEEIPVPGLKVTFLKEMRDVTKIIDKAKDREEAKSKILAEAAADYSNCQVTLTDFYSGNAWYLIVTKTYSDVRFVGAPPASMGKFGGDTDNWMWPRHTCDFSMFRIYAGPGNEPAEYSSENVPYTSETALKISLKGYNDGDFAMVIGFPGRTQRFQTAAQLQSMLEVNDIAIAARTVRQDVMWEAMRADEKTGIQYATKYHRSSNGWKKWIGMKDSFTRLDVISRQLQKEAEFNKWVALSPTRAKTYGGALSRISSICDRTLESRKSSTLLLETLYRIELQAFKPEATEDDYRDYDVEVDRKVAAALVDFYLDNVKPDEQVSVPDLDELYSRSVFTSWTKLQRAREAGIKLTDDPAMKFHRDILKMYSQLYKTVKDSQEDLNGAMKTYTAGLLEWKKNTASYPDANFTMRLTYGSVKSYEPKDGIIYKHYTTLKGVMEKWDETNYDFRVPERLRSLYQSRDYLEYANSAGEMPTCFLTNCDITGGNSGSPVLNGKGELIGLAFDGNWESMSGDVLFEPNFQRCICVDIRYVLLAMDKFGSAGYLKDEMTFATK